MPSLKQLRCEIEWGNTKTPFPEYGTTYGDGVVETYIAIPDHPQPFAVHLTSKSYIAEGLAMFVFMDGDYQCNRNRLNLKPPSPETPQSLTQVDFRVRQKEKPLGDGTYLGRGWRFDKHNIVPLDQIPDNVDRQHFDDLGQISVLVLRCRAKDDILFQSPASSNADDALLTPEAENETPTEDTQSSPADQQEADEAEPDGLGGFMNDGAADVYRFGLDGEGPGPEQMAWSWNASYPPPPAAQGQPSGPVPGQPHPAHVLPQGSLGYPSHYSQSWHPGPAMNQHRPENQRPQRRVHFNDQVPPQQSGQGVSTQGYSQQQSNPNMGQSQSRPNPQQPGSYQNQQPTYQPNQGHPQQSSNYGNPPSNAYPNQLQGHGPVPGGYANPYGGMPAAQNYRGGFSMVPDYSYQPPIPSYHPTTYGALGYTGWHSGESYPAYAQSSWPREYMPGPSYMAPPNFAPWYQASYPYPYPQPTLPSGLFPSTSPNSEQPASEVGNFAPKTGSLDPAKEENNQTDAQNNENQGDASNEAQENASNVGDSSTDNNNQGWDNNDGNQTQNNNDTGGGQNGVWNTTASQTEAQTNDWNQPTANTGQTYDADGSWNTNAATSTQATNTSNNAPVSTHQSAAAITSPQQVLPPISPQQVLPSTYRQQVLPQALPVRSRPLYGPHGTYYSSSTSFAHQGPRPDAAEEPSYDVPASTLTTHQVKPGEGYLYIHKRRSPDYIDTLDDPYARFVFKYRTKEQIENETGIKIEDEPTGDEEKRKLQDLKKDEIIDMLLRAKSALGGTVPSPPSLAPKSDESTSNNAEPAAIPAPTQSFLSYSVPTARSVSNRSASSNVVGLGVSMPAPAANSTHDLGAGNANYAASMAAASHQQQPAPYGWVLAPVPTDPQQQPQSPQQDQQQADTWNAQIRSPLSQSQHQPQPQQQQQQPQQQATQPQIQSIQNDTTIHTYKSGSGTYSTSAPTVVGTSSDRPVTPPGGWNQAAAGSVAGSAVGAGWGSGGGAPTQPDSGW